MGTFSMNQSSQGAFRRAQEKFHFLPKMANFGFWKSHPRVPPPDPQKYFSSGFFARKTREGFWYISEKSALKMYTYEFRHWYFEGSLLFFSRTFSKNVFSLKTIIYGCPESQQEGPD